MPDREPLLGRVLLGALAAVGRLFGVSISARQEVDTAAVRSALESIGPVVHAEVLAGARAVLHTLVLPSAEVRGAFDLVDARAVAYAEQQSARLVTEVTEEVRAFVADITRRAVQGEFTWPQAAAQIRLRVGLTSRWERAVDRSRTDNLHRLLRDGMLPAKATVLVDKQAEAYAKRLVKTRAETIARTEIMAAQNQGRLIGWQSLQGQGLLAPTAQKSWLTAPEGTKRGGPCPICRPLNGETVPMNGLFSIGVTMPPAHPRCRCTATLVV